MAHCREWGRKTHGPRVSVGAPPRVQSSGGCNVEDLRMPLAMYMIRRLPERHVNLNAWAARRVAPNSKPPTIMYVEEVSLLVYLDLRYRLSGALVLEDLAWYRSLLTLR